MLKTKLETWMLKTKCTRLQLAELLKVSPRTIDGWLAHKARPISAKMRKTIEELIAPKNTVKVLSDSEKEFYALTDKNERDFWLQEKVERILVLAHRVMAYWDTNYTNSGGDSEFFEEVTDLTLQIREISTDVTALGTAHADNLLFNECDKNSDA